MNVKLYTLFGFVTLFASCVFGADKLLKEAGQQLPFLNGSGEFVRQSSDVEGGLVRQHTDSFAPPTPSRILEKRASFKRSGLIGDHCNSRATAVDIPQLMALYDNFDDEDRRKLVVFPIELREQVLRSSIEKGRVFVTKSDHGEILSFCKAFIIDNGKDFNDIIIGELRTNTASMNSSVFRDNGTLSAVFKYSADVAVPEPTLLPHASQLIFAPNDMCVYFGGAFTMKEYRGAGVNTDLERYALKKIKEQIVNNVVEDGNRIRVVHYLYGVVEDNYHDRETRHMHFARFRTFTELTRNLSIALDCSAAPQDGRDGLAMLNYEFHAFRAYKPSFYMNGTSLCVLPDEHPATQAGAGYGCVISWRLE